jgi:predicted nucleic acid-binding protein
VTKAAGSSIAVRSLYDTNILIDYLNGIKAARTEISGASDPAISTITWIEVMAGVPPAVGDAVRRFLATFRQLAVTPEVAERAVAIRRAVKMKLPDAIILATAQEDGRTLVTRNTKDFVQGMAGVRIPYRFDRNVAKDSLSAWRRR